MSDGFHPVVVGGVVVIVVPPPAPSRFAMTSAEMKDAAAGIARRLDGGAPSLFVCDLPKKEDVSDE